jgi:acyl-coenzyme A synthetase/AMP-(fatty) acid ligase
MRAVVLDALGGYMRDAAMDETGTLVVRGPNQFKGYLSDHHNQGLWIDIPDANGQAQRWLNTGDLGRQDADGYFWLTGRAKELIIRGGHNIDPKVIEEALCAHPAVALCAAVGRPDAHAGEVPVAYVQLREGNNATETELLTYAHSHIGERAAHPKAIRLLPALPVTAVGKIFKPTLSMREVASVVNEESNALGIALQSLQVVQDPKRGIVAQVAVATPERERMQTAMGRYAFGLDLTSN